MGGEGDVPHGAVAGQSRAVGGEPRPAVHRLVKRRVGRVVLSLRKGAFLGLRFRSTQFDSIHFYDISGKLINSLIEKY